MYLKSAQHVQTRNWDQLSAEKDISQVSSASKGLVFEVDHLTWQCLIRCHSWIKAQARVGLPWSRSSGWDGVGLSAGLWFDLWIWVNLSRTWNLAAIKGGEVPNKKPTMIPRVREIRVREIWSTSPRWMDLAGWMDGWMIEPERPCFFFGLAWIFIFDLRISYWWLNRTTAPAAMVRPSTWGLQFLETKRCPGNYDRVHKQNHAASWHIYGTWPIYRWFLPIKQRWFSTAMLGYQRVTWCVPRRCFCSLGAAPKSLINGLV